MAEHQLAELKWCRVRLFPLLSQVRREMEEGSDPDADDGIMTVVERMLAEPAPLWHSKKLLLQSADEVAVVEGGSLQSISAISGDPPAGHGPAQDAPHICQVCISEAVRFITLAWKMPGAASRFGTLICLLAGASRRRLRQACLAEVRSTQYSWQLCRYTQES